MNEKIKELWDQASGEFCKQNPYATIMLPAPLREKFAELIVQECAEVVKNQYSEDWGKWSNRMILEHFGVEE